MFNLTFYIIVKRKLKVLIQLKGERPIQKYLPKVTLPLPKVSGFNNQVSFVLFVFVSINVDIYH